MLKLLVNLELKKSFTLPPARFYGTARYVPIDENHPLQGQSPYAATKIGADQLALALLSFIWHTGCCYSSVQHVWTASISASGKTYSDYSACRRQQIIKLGSIHPTRDFNYVKDTVQGFIARAACDLAVGEIN